MPGPVVRPSRRASSSSSCRAGCRARARPSAASPSRSTRCSAFGSSRGGGDARELRREARELVGEVGLERRAACSSPQSGRRRAAPTSKPCAVVGGGLRVRERRVRRRCTTCCGRTPSRRPSSPAGSRPCRRRSGRRVPPLAWSSPVMTTTAFLPCGKYQKRGSGLRVAGSSCRSGSRAAAAARRPAGSRPCRESTQSGWTSPAWRRRTGRRSGSARPAVALLAGPRRIALARVDDRAREVVGERGRLAAVACRRCAA